MENMSESISEKINIYYNNFINFKNKKPTILKLSWDNYILLKNEVSKYNFPPNVDEIKKYMDMEIKELPYNYINSIFLE